MGLVLIHIGGTADAAIHATTRTNWTVRERSKVEFGCESTLGSMIRWHYNRPPGKDLIVLYNGYSLDSNAAGRFSVTRTASSNEITINNVAIEDSGVYSCHEMKNISRNVTFQLVVIGISFINVLQTNNL